MKVTILCSYPPYRFHNELRINKSSVQRITTWNETLIDELSKINDINIQVITGNTVINKKTSIINGNLEVIFLPMPKLKNIFTLYQYTRFLAARLISEFSPDIVHGIGTEHIWPYVAINSDRTSVVTVHGVISEIARKVPPKVLSQRRFFAWLEPRVLKQTKHLITINPYVKETLGAYTSATMYPIENPVNDIFFDAHTSTTNKTNEYMLFVGSIEPLKGIHDLIEAMSLLKRQNKSCPNLIIVGPVVNNEYAEYLYKMIAELNLKQSIEFTGFTLPDKLKIMYANAQFLVLPSRQETAPMCIAEAMSCGIPVIASTVGGIPHMIEEGVTGYLFTSGDTKSIASKIDALYSDNALRDEMSKKARETALRRWKPDVIAMQTAEVYKSIINN